MKNKSNEILFKDLINPTGKINGVMRLYVAVNSVDENFMRQSSDLFDQVYELARKKFKIESNNIALTFDYFTPELSEDGAIHVTYERDDDYGERLRRRVEKLKR